MEHKIKILIRKVKHFLDIRPSSDPFISGDSFRSICDFVYDEKRSFNPQKVFLHAKIFVKADKLKYFFKDIHPLITNKYILISHNADTNIDQEYFKFIDEKIIHWFAQNNISEHPKITPIPIGLENRYFNQNGNVNLINRTRKQNQIKVNKILYGFNTNTNIEERTKALDYLKKNKLAEGIKKRLDPYQYISELKRYKYVASPPGNGFDCIRTWEALYLNVIPVVKRNYNTEFFLNIGCPLLIIDDWEMLNSIDEKYLINYYDNHKIFFKNDFIFMGYWINRINKYKNYE